MSQSAQARVDVYLAIGKEEPADDGGASSMGAKPEPAPAAYAPTEEELKDAASRLSNPAVKIKKDSQFSWKVVTDRLAAVGLARHPIAASDATLSFTFNRHYLHKLYGGSFVDTFPHPELLKVRFHGVDDFMCLRLDCNPHAPVNPGDPGLLFTYRAVDRFAKYAARVNRVFVRTQASPALWQYMGQYRLYTSEALTKDEFARQTSAVRTTWAKAVLVRSEGNEICVRVHLRKTKGREPAQDDVSNVTRDKKRVKRAKSQLTSFDIAAAYERGEEEIQVYTMKCIGYDVEFQRVLAENYKNFTAPRQKPRPKAEQSPGKAVAEKRKRGVSVPEMSKSDRQKDDVDAEGECEETEAEDGEEELSDVDEPHYVPRATRSRPDAKVKPFRSE